MGEITPLIQLAICDVCLSATADRCHVRLELTLCPICAALIFGAEAARNIDEREAA